jgi:DNA-binding CsgD family transcriptional regulator
MPRNSSLTPADRRELDQVRHLCGARLSRTELLQSLADRIRRYTESDGYCFCLIDPASGLPVQVVGTHDAEARQRYVDRVFRRTPLSDLGWLSRQPQRIQCAEQLVAAPDEDPLIREMLVQYGLRPEVGVSFAEDGYGWGYLHLARQIGRPDYDGADKAFLAALVPAVTEALRRSAAWALLTAAPGPGAGVVTFDTEGHVEAMNEVGEALVSGSDGPNSFHLAVAVMGQLLRQSIREGAPAPRETVPVVVDGTRRRYRVRPELLKGGDGRARGAVVIEPLRALDEEAAMLQLGLTRRETDVAATTMRGLSTRDAASALGLSPHTVEHHLRNVFGKLGVGSRSEMTALILGN